MMKAIAAAVLMIAMTGPASALQPWQQRGGEAIMRVSPSVLEYHWPQSISLWLRVLRDGTDWNVAGRQFCRTLDGAGRPRGAYVVIRIWRHDMEQQLARIEC